MSDYSYVGTELDVFALAVNWKRYFGDLISPYLRGRVLEVGAGLGETTRALLGPGLDSWLCLEPDPLLAARLATGPFPTGPCPEIVVGDISSVSIDRRFDTIVYVDVLEHIRDDAGELRKARRLLAPGGHLVVLSPAFQFLFSEFDRSIGHERRYTRKTLGAVMPADLAPVLTLYADCIGMLLSLSNRLLLRASTPKRSQILFWDRRIIPLSRLFDPLFRHYAGRSIIAVYRSP